MEIKKPLPPFTLETARQKVQAAEDAWNSRDPEKVSFAYPVVTVSKTAQDGDYVFCTVCTGKLRLHQSEETFATEFQGKFGSAAEVQPEADMEPIDDFVKLVLSEFEV